LSLENYSSLDGTAEVIYNSSVDIGGFQFDIEGATLTGASGGEAENNGFVQSSSPTTILGFSFTGATIPVGEGILCMITFSDLIDQVCITEPVMSDGNGNSLDVILTNHCLGGAEIEGCMDSTGCNYNENATIGVDCYYPEEYFDCDGNCLVEYDCNGVCGGNETEDNCGVCDSDSSNDCIQGCDGIWGSNAELDACYVCNGDGPNYLCDNEQLACNESQCISTDCSSGGYMPSYGPECQWNTFGSTVQSFISFNDITFNGEEIDNGQEGGATGICENNDCDIIAVIYDGRSVGWSYMPIINNSITLVVELKDANTQAVEFYPQVIPGIFEPTVTFNFYDASEGKIYYNVGSTQPAVQSLVNFGSLNITGNGDICSSDGFEFGESEFCIEGNGCNMTQYCNDEMTTNFDAIGNNTQSCEIISTCGHPEAVNYDSNIECSYFENDFNLCQFNGCEDTEALNFNLDEFVDYEEFNAGCFYNPFEWNPSTQQSFYVINELIVDSEYITEENSYLVIGAYCNGVVVGSAEWSGTTTTIAVYGSDGLTDGTEDYCQGGISSPIELPGDVPTFKVYNPLNEIYYNAFHESCLDIEGNSSNCEWVNFGFNNIPELTTTIPGCTNSNACNFNQFATVDDGSCWTANNGCTCEFPQGSVVDCFGECAGIAFEDDCGICNGFNNDMDCSGECFGIAVVDECEICTEGNTGLNFNTDMDCSGTCFGNAELDDCGECGGNGYDQCDYDENGVPNITQYGYGVYNIEMIDIPEDQGYQIYISFSGSFLDNQASQQTSKNNLEREVEVYQVERFDEIGWVSVGQSVMYGQNNYTIQVSTIVNQTNNSNGLSTFRVLSAFEDNIIISFENGVGASIDNLIPQIPENLNGNYQNNMVQLNWSNPIDDDFQYFKIYKNNELINYSTSSEFFDESPSIGINNFYQISAVDINGNESSQSIEMTAMEICNHENSTCYGCVDIGAENYSTSAIIDNGSCEFSPIVIQNEDLTNYNNEIDISISDIELTEMEIDINIPAGAFNIPNGSEVTLEVSEASESELENILYYSSSSESGIEILQGCSFQALDENGNEIELIDGATINVEISFELIRNEFDVGFVENGEIIGLNAGCMDNNDGTMTCSGNGSNFGSYIIFSYDPNTMIMGCTEENACNFDNTVNMNDGSCFFYGIYNCNGNCVNDLDLDLVCDELEILGCTDMEANNFNEEATDNDGTCNFGYNLSQQLIFGNNLLSLPGELENSSTIHQMDLIQSNDETIEFIIGQGVGLFNTADGWTGNLNNLSPYSGYWINISSTENYQWDLEFNSPIENCEIYPNINVGNNLMSFKWGEGSALTINALGGQEFADENFNFIIGQGVGLFNTSEGWAGNLNSIEEGKGYWVNVSNENIDEFKWGFESCENNPTNLGLSIHENEIYMSEEFQVNQSTNQGFYLINTILIDSKKSAEDDILLAYSGEILVGSAVCENSVTVLPVMGQDLSPQTDGFIEIGEIPTFKLLSHQTGKLIDLEASLEGFNNLLVSEVDIISGNSVKLPTDYLLHPAYPNPFNPITTIEFSIPTDNINGFSIQIYDINGKLIKTVINGEINPGKHSIEWDASQNPSGVYFVKMVTDNFIQSQKLLLIK
jgi:hypothetical protein